MIFKFTKGYENYAKFPMHYLRVTQGWNKGNHIPHWDSANYKDYPIDLGGMDGGRDYLYAPVDMKIVALNGIGNSSVSNKIFLESVNKVITPSHGTTKIFMTAVHFNDSDVSKFGLKVGKIIKAGEPICFEGTETATANHLHFTCGVGSATKSIQNNKGKWVTKGNCKKPEEIFYIDNNFTIVEDMGGVTFKNLPTLEEILKSIGIPTNRDTTKDQIEVIVDQLRVRSNGNTNSTILGYAKKGIYNYTETKKANNYTWYNIGIGWIAYTNKWCNVYEKEEVIVEIPEIKEEELPKKEEETPVKEENITPEVEIPSNENKKEESSVIVPSKEKNENEANSSVNKEEVVSVLQKIVEFIKKIINLIVK